MNTFKAGDRVRIAALGGFMTCEDQGIVVGYTGTVIARRRDDEEHLVRVVIDRHLMSDPEQWGEWDWGFSASNLEHINDKPIQYAKIVPINSERSLRRYTMGDNPWRIQLRSACGRWMDATDKQQAYRCLRGQFGGAEYREVRAIQPGLPVSEA